MPIITPDDLTPFATIPADAAAAMIADAIAQAVLVAPCLDDDTLSEQHRAAARAVLRRAVLRWHETGITGSVTTQAAGPFSQTVTTVQRGGLFWPSEIEALQAICRSDGVPGRAFTIRPALSTAPVGHQPWCSIMWGDSCSCGANLTNGEYPLWEGGALS